MDIFDEVSAILRQARERGVIVHEPDPLTGELISYRVRHEGGVEVREQLFPPPLAEPRRRRRHVRIRGWWLLVVPATLCGLRLLGWL